MIVTTSELFAKAYGKYAVGAYNINNLEQTVGLFRGNLGIVNSNDEPVDFDPRTAGKPFMAAYAQYIAHKNRQLGSAGQLEGVRAALRGQPV